MPPLMPPAFAAAIAADDAVIFFYAILLRAAIAYFRCLPRHALMLFTLLLLMPPRVDVMPPAQNGARTEREARNARYHHTMQRRYMRA